MLQTSLHYGTCTLALWWSRLLWNRHLQVARGCLICQSLRMFLRLLRTCHCHSARARLHHRRWPALRCVSSSSIRCCSSLQQAFSSAGRAEFHSDHLMFPFSQRRPTSTSSHPLTASWSCCTPWGRHISASAEFGRRNRAGFYGNWCRFFFQTEWTGQA